MSTTGSSINRSANQRRWQAHVKAQAESGLNRSEYCKQHGLSYDAMTYWRRKLTGNKQTGKTAMLVPIAMEAISSRRRAQWCPTALQILLPGNVAVAVNDDFSSTTLTRLLSVLETR